MTSKNNQKKSRWSLMSDNSSKGQLYTVVVPIFDEVLGEWTVQLALDLVRFRRSRVVLAGMVRVPAEESLSVGTGQAQAIRATLDRLRTRFEGEPIYIKPRVRVVYEPWRSLAKVVTKEQASLMLIPWPHNGAKALFGMKIGRLLSRLNCHVVVVSGDMPAQLDRILLPLRGSQEAPLRG
jgi:hypothetical protein